MRTEHFDPVYAYGSMLCTLTIQPDEHEREPARVTVQTAETEGERAQMMQLYRFTAWHNQHATSVKG